MTNNTTNNLMEKVETNQKVFNKTMDFVKNIIKVIENKNLDNTSKFTESGNLVINLINDYKNEIQKESNSETEYVKMIETIESSESVFTSTDSLTKEDKEYILIDLIHDAVENLEYTLSQEDLDDNSFINIYVDNYVNIISKIYLQYTEILTDDFRSLVLQTSISPFNDESINNREELVNEACIVLTTIANSLDK